MSFQALRDATVTNQGQLLRILDLERVRRYRAADIWDTSLALRSDPYTWETALLDPNTYDVIQQRVGLAAGFRWRYVAASDRDEDRRVAQIMQHLHGLARRHAQALRRLAVADFRGKAFEFVESERSREALGGGPPLEWWHPTGFQEVSADRFVLHQDDDGLWRWRLYSLVRSRFEPLEPRFSASLISHVFDGSVSNMHHGTHLLDAINLWLYLKGQAVQAWAAAAERWGEGFLVVKVNSLERPSKSRSAADIQGDYLTAIQAAKARHGMVIDALDGIELLGGPGEGWQVLVELVRLCDDSIRIAGLGTALGARAENGAFGHGREAQVGQDATHTQVGYSRALKAEDVDATLGAAIWSNNRANFRRIGLGGARRATFALDDEITLEPKDAADVFARIAPFLEVSASEAREKLGYRSPEPGEERVGGTGLTRPQLDGLASMARLGRTNGSAAPTWIPPEDAERVGHQARQVLRAALSPAMSTLVLEQERCPDGTFKPEGGACPEHAPVTEAPQRQKAARSAPGSQFPDAVRARFKELGLKKLPDASIPAESVEMNLEGADLHERAVLKWTDRNGRKQREYTPQFHARNAERKWARVQAFEPRAAQATARLEAAVDAEKHGTREHASATVALLIARTGMRPGGSGDSEARGIFGASTLRPEHVTIDGDDVRFAFRGKSGKDNAWSVRDARLARAIGGYVERGTEGQRLFPATVQDARSASKAAGGVKLKDWRTLAATRGAREVLASIRPPPPLATEGRARNRQLVAVEMEAAKAIAARLNNTPALARSSYIHPEVWNEWRTRIGAA